MYDFIGRVQVYKKKFNDLLIQYRVRYENSNIMFIDEGQYHSEDNSEDNCLIMSLSWRFDG